MQIRFHRHKTNDINVPLGFGDVLRNEFPVSEEHPNTHKRQRNINTRTQTRRLLQRKLLCLD